MAANVSAATVIPIATLRLVIDRNDMVILE
jgi:hypothetical protein